MIPAVFKLVPRIAPVVAAALVGLIASAVSEEVNIEPPEPPEDLDACVRYVLAEGSNILRTIRPEKWTEIKSTGMYWTLEQGGLPEMLVGRLFQYHVIEGYSDFHARWLLTGNSCRANRVAILALVECLGWEDPNPQDFMADARRFEPVERAQREEEIRLVREQRVRFAKQFHLALSRNPSKSPKIRQIKAAFKKTAEGAGDRPEEHATHAPEKSGVIDGAPATTSEADIKRIADDVFDAARILSTADPDGPAKELTARMMSNDPKIATAALLEASLRISPTSGVSDYKWYLCRESERATRMAIVALRESLTTDRNLYCFDGHPKRFAPPEGMHRQEELDFAKKNKQMFAQTFYQELEKNPSKSPKVKELLDRLRFVAGLPRTPVSNPADPAHP
jgi:hypothetical protein